MEVNNETKEEKVVALCIYYVDVNNFKNRRVIISHLSVSEIIIQTTPNLDNPNEEDHKKFENWVEKVTDYIFTNDVCTEDVATSVELCLIGGLIYNH